MDFYRIKVSKKQNALDEIRPDWRFGPSDDLMIRGNAFYAIWDEEAGIWSKNIHDVQRLVDQDLWREKEQLEKKNGETYSVATLASNDTKLWSGFQKYIRESGDNFHNLDETLVFENTEVRKEMYASKRLPYSLHEGPCVAWDQIVGTLYDEEERAKIEWAIGAIVSGDSKLIQKFLVLYGPPGSGKSTLLNIIAKLFGGYTATFVSRELSSSSNAFATAAFQSNPLVAIEHDGDLSRIYDNTKLNSIVSHEVMKVNEKYRREVDMRFNAFLFMGTNVPVKITDAKSGIIRRLIDVVPNEQTIPFVEYSQLMDQIEFELGAIAQKCLQRYLAMGMNYYSAYKPVGMMLLTNVFYNFVEYNFDILKREPGISLKQAYTLYKEYGVETGIDKLIPQYKFQAELASYFRHHEKRKMIEGVAYYNFYSGFKHPSDIPSIPLVPSIPVSKPWLDLREMTSIFDEAYKDQPAQYAAASGGPSMAWSKVKTKLSDLDTSKLHWVKVPENHVVIDFDLTDEEGEKSLDLNIQAASKFQITYAEASKSGKGIHLHYIYIGDPHILKNDFAKGVEVKTLLGDSALRRQLTTCTANDITSLTGGLPRKEKALLSPQSIKSEKGLRDLIERNLRKEIHPATKPSIDFIHKILEEAYDAGMSYDLTDMRPTILTFAMQASNQSAQAVRLVQKMKFVGQEETQEPEPEDDAPLVFYDVEVFPNLLVVCWKIAGEDKNVVRMVNPEPKDIEPLLNMKLVGFNNRRYDNHILYARYIGWTIPEIYQLSDKVINGNNRDALFGEAYNLSYADIYDYTSKKQSLKKYQIDLGIFHSELDLPWDKPVPEELWKNVEEYCVNDVVSTEAVFNHPERQQDFVARQILAELSGLSVNHTTQAHTAKIIFGDDKNAQSVFEYTKLEEEFPGYHFDGKESVYHGEITGEGGYVYAEPGIYEDVAVLDVASMHPTSIRHLNAFGPYTARFNDLVDARLAIKGKDYEKARTLLDGKLAKFVDGNEDNAAELSYALKIVINIVYGLTSAHFDNPFNDYRNKDNFVAKRGALFMIDLKHEVQAKGFSVVHIKTDSIKIPNATEEIIQHVIDFGHKYGYTFEHEVTYKQFCLVNDAVYIATDGDMWKAVGAQFQHPYVFKTLFSGEDLVPQDFCETKSVMKGSMYLDFTGSDDPSMMIHVGRTGSFVPVAEEGANLWRIYEDRLYAVSGTKGYKWVNREIALERDPEIVSVVDMTYFETLVQKAESAIKQYGVDDSWFPLKGK